MAILYLAFLVAAMAYYFVWLGGKAIWLFQQGDFALTLLGIGILILPFLGVWVVATSIRAALAHQHLARRMHDEGRELDTSDLPRRASGRIERAAADTLFEQVKQEWEAAPDDWRNSYRVARAYDYAGDRTRARAAMRRAVELERRERRAESA
ncbi:hypothetical protein D5S18_15010 [Nocardia panacis]|uniref:Uncharacterized protein n=1 Tax=Nocardia panacis TaxID=2340916 RepID=A0A3A4KKP5_9NOCA|nr:hypothetical protein [Nocardia panacis]RJO75281.1 hypothetical protein D5S18_15010 [Nocardia panacis]